VAIGHSIGRLPKSAAPQAAGRPRNAGLMSTTDVQGACQICTRLRGFHSGASHIEPTQNWRRERKAAFCMEPTEACRRLQYTHGVRGANRTSMRSTRGGFSVSGHLKVVFPFPSRDGKSCISDDYKDLIYRQPPSSVWDTGPMLIETQQSGAWSQLIFLLPFHVNPRRAVGGNANFRRPANDQR